MMEVIKLLIPLVGVGLGWFLKSASDLLSERRERRQVFGKALAEGLMLRSLIVVPTDEILEYIQRRLGPSAQITDEDRRTFHAFMRDWMKRFPVSLDNFRYAFDQIACSDPIESVELRWAVHIQDLEAHIDSLSSSQDLIADPASLQEFESAKRILMDISITDFDNCLLRMAANHGVMTRFRLRKALREWKNIDRKPGFEHMVDRIMALAPATDAHGHVRGAVGEHLEQTVGDRSADPQKLDDSASDLGEASRAH